VPPSKRNGGQCPPYRESRTPPDLISWPPARLRQDAGFLIFSPLQPGLTKPGFFIILVEKLWSFQAMAPLGQTLDNFLDEFSRLSIEDQEMLLGILKKRNIEQKRMRIVREVKEAQREHKKGLTKRGRVEDLMRDLESD
jgi:hypothetical protein